MFQLLQSIGLLAIAGIMVPLIIHFWNVKQGKTLKIGSIALLKESSRTSARSWKLRDLLLLTLRCLLLILLALLLSEPIWRKQIAPAPKAGWVMIEKQNLGETYKKFRSRIDSLRKAGFELHYFNSGFEKIQNPDEALLTQKDTAEAAALSYWTLLKELDHKVESDQNVYLFTPNRLSRISGSRPEVNFNLRWYSYTPKDSVAEWISDAYLNGPEKIRLTMARSDGSSTQYSTVIIPATGNEVVRTEFVEGKLIAVLKKDSAQTPVPVNIGQMVITIFADQVQDATYLQSALEAIRAYNGRNLKIQRFQDASRIPGQQDWLFWLSDRPVPQRLIAQNRFIYKAGKPTDIATVLNISGELSISGEPIPLYKRIGSDPDISAASVWEDGFGDPILSVKKNRNSTDYIFYSRINPAWSDLPWREEFPGLIHDLLFEISDSTRNGKDLRTTSQLLPEFQSAVSSSKKAPVTATVPLHRLFWLLALGIFILERVLAFKKRRVTHG